MSRRKKILFITPYPQGEAPSQRFRFEQYFGALQSKQIEFKTQSFLTHSNWRLFYSNGNLVAKVLALMQGFCRRIVGLAVAWKVDYVFVHREAAPIGPPVFEWMISKVMRKQIIYDFDDAIWLTDLKNESTLNKLLKWRGKVSTICKWSWRVSCGNEYLCSYARQFAREVILMPTTIDTSGMHVPENSAIASGRASALTIGWTGSHSTLKYLNELESTLQEVEATFPQTQFVVIADAEPALKLNRLRFVRWNKRTEIDELRMLDIGVMPLPDDEWSKGKCGFKILQYMALGIPSVSSPVGVNRDIVKDGKNGFLCRTSYEWKVRLSELIEHKALREKLGKEGRQTVISHYSVSANISRFLSLFA